MYEQAAKLAELAENGRSYKTALYAIKNKKIIKSVHFLSENAVSKRTLIDQLLCKTGLSEDARRRPWLARVAVAQLLWGRWRLPTHPPLFRKITRLKEKFLEVLPTLDFKEDVKIPRYLRINTDILARGRIEDTLKSEGFHLVPTPPTYSAFLGLLGKLKDNQFVFDFNVPNIIVFNRKTDISALHPHAYIRQDKSSCLVGLLLAPVAGSVVLDMCAAPGYKTQHASSLIYKMGKVYSVDINKERFETLENTVKTFQLEEVCQPLNMDALKVTEETCPNVEYIIVDPPCSGTGMANVLVKHTADKTRLRKLHNLQAMMLKHALSTFPCARRLVYSTCSVEEEENEEVVSECLATAEREGFRLVPLGGAFGGCLSAGRGTYPCSPCVLRLSPDSDLTNGFFIALFERSVPPKLPVSPPQSLSLQLSDSASDTSAHSTDTSLDETSLMNGIIQRRKKTNLEKTTKKPKSFNPEIKSDIKVESRETDSIDPEQNAPIVLEHVPIKNKCLSKQKLILKSFNKYNSARRFKNKILKQPKVVPTTKKKKLKMSSKSL